jgi:hypothetical protein
MDEKETESKKEEETKSAVDEHPAQEQAEHPVPGIKHEKEPDAENIMPAEDRPGTL